MPQNIRKAIVNPLLLQWKDRNLPISPLFMESYYSAPHDGNDGRSETQAVYIAGNNLPNRWKTQADCTIAELGFGTGLNFFETVHQWHEISPSQAQLTYVSFEQYPISKAQILKAFSPWPDLLAFTTQLFAKLATHSQSYSYDASISHAQGWTVPLSCQIGDKTLALYLVIGDANRLLPLWKKQDFSNVDAWYLDGFSPAKNPELWNQDLMQAVFNATASNGTFSTYTSAGQVRRALSEAGFEVQKVKGFGKKRHRLEGVKM